MEGWSYYNANRSSRNCVMNHELKTVWYHEANLLFLQSPLEQSAVAVFNIGSSRIGDHRFHFHVVKWHRNL
jgi:hypothetical protein